MTEELLDLHDIAAMYRCSHRHARDVITKMIGFPEVAPGSTRSKPVWPTYTKTANAGERKLRTDLTW